LSDLFYFFFISNSFTSHNPVITIHENEEIARKKRLKTDSDSGKISQEKVLKYLESMQNNFDTLSFKPTEGEVSSIRSIASTSTASSKRHLYPVKTSDNVMGNILVRTPTREEQPIFERLLNCKRNHCFDGIRVFGGQIFVTYLLNLVRMTVSNGFSFQWIENQATLELF
jgi:hypothetical protein